MELFTGLNADAKAARNRIGMAVGLTKKPMFATKKTACIGKGFGFQVRQKGTRTEEDRRRDKQKHATQNLFSLLKKTLARHTIPTENGKRRQGSTNIVWAHNYK